ncbi:MAG TPA: hypothetical protein PKC30_14885 [Saprospiraceae bacterium]|nr:hypothetical protein [Saprospiraceae bacterium]
MNKLEFHRTSNIFINTGIVALHRCLKKYNDLESHCFGEIKNILLSEKLILENENLLNLLEEVYYYMGKEVYDTPNERQKIENANVYYDSKNNSFKRFPKMNTYGLTTLLTNNAQGTTRKKENSPKIKDLEKSKPELAEKFKKYYFQHGLKLLAKVYIDEPYSKITTLELSEKYFQNGEKNCPIIGEGFKQLLTGQNISPFLSGLSNFNTFLESSDRKISLKALYLLRFAPALSMYSYYNYRDSLSCSFFNSSNLQNINTLYANEFYFTKNEMESFKVPFQKNIRLEKFKFLNKDNEEFEIGGGEESYSPAEITFLLLYTFFKKKFQFDFDDENINSEIDPFEDSPYEKMPISIVTLKADKFASTMRPNFFEEYSNIKFIIRLMYYLESNKPRIPIGELWRGLIVKTQKSDSIKDYTKRQYLERNLRTNFISRILKGKSLLSVIEDLFSKAFLQLVNNQTAGYRKYSLFIEFLKIYEPIIKFGGMKMDKNLQQRALNLGKSIGQGIINLDSPKNFNDKKANAKNGRKYIISMHKARTITQFRDVLIRIQRKYAISVSNEILENIDENNYVAIKQYAQLGALNILNTVMSNQNSNLNEN